MTVLAGIEGVQNISDDIIMHGKDVVTHNERIHAVMKRLKEYGLTLNHDKCQFNMDRLVFMGDPSVAERNRSNGGEGEISV